MAAAIRTLLLLSLSCASAVMLQRNVTSEPMEDPCECIGWHDAFVLSMHGADCMALGDWVCYRFLRQLPNEKFCMNHEFLGQADSRQWCYVSDSCAAGQPIQWTGTSKEGRKWNSIQPMKFKTCGEDDPKLGDKDPMELFEWTKAHNLAYGLAAHLAYPLLDQNVKLNSDVMSFFGLTLPEGAPDNKVANVSQLSDNTAFQQRLQQRAAEGKTALFSSDNGHPPFGIMKGKKLYWVNWSDDEKELVESHKDVFSKLGTMNEVKCVAGCKDTQPAWMSPLNEMWKEYLAEHPETTL